MINDILLNFKIYLTGGLWVFQKISRNCTIIISHFATSPVSNTLAVASNSTMRSLYLLFLLSPFTIFSQSKIQPALETFLSDPVLQNASVSITVTEVNSGATLASYDSNRSLIPASSLKTVTTATALSVLGADYRYKTELQYSGSIDEAGTLHGDLYIKGYGDPTLGTEWLDQADDMPTILSKFTTAIQAAGIKKINGHVIGDGSFFPTSPVASTWQWEDMGNYYGAGAFGLNLHENWYWLDFQQNMKLDSTPMVKTVRPEVPVVFIENLVRSAPRGTGDNAYIYGAPSVSYTHLTLPTILLV